jgi:recombination protein RecR
VVESVGDLWAIERSGTFRGHYHVLGGALSASRGVTPQDLALQSLMERVQSGAVHEVILALNATTEGMVTSHYLTDALSQTQVTITALAHGVPVGGELDYLDDGTLVAALAARRPFFDT